MKKYKYEDESFETVSELGLFRISIEGEGDMSADGGYTFETTTHSVELGNAEVKMLISELKEHLKETK